MTTSMPWIKLYTEMLDDPKIGRLSIALRWRFVELLLLAGECDEDGALIGSGFPLSASDIAWRLRCETGALMDDLHALEAAGLVAYDGEAWLIVKFAARQGRPQKERRELWRTAQQRHRDNTDDVMHDTSMTLAPRVREEIEEEIEEIVASTPLTVTDITASFTVPVTVI